jgi:hypothetical protein
LASLQLLLYILSSTLLIVHEIDSAYWREWELFNIPGGVSGFLSLHIPIVLLLLYGAVEVNLGTRFGHALNIIVALSGVFAFSIHSYFIRAGNNQFKTMTSQALLYSILVTSILQLILTMKT